MFDPVRVEWTDLSELAAAQGSTPPARLDPGMASADGRIIMFGGWGNYPASWVPPSRSLGILEAPSTDKEPGGKLHPQTGGTLVLWREGGIPRSSRSVRFFKLQS